MYNGVNKWIKLSEYMRTAIIRGCTDEEKLKRLALRHAWYLFGNEGGTVIDKKLEEEIRAFISSFIWQIKEEVRRGGEPYKNIDLNVVRVRLIEARIGDKIYKR